MACHQYAFRPLKEFVDYYTGQRFYTVDAHFIPEYDELGNGTCQSIELGLPGEYEFASRRLETILSIERKHWYRLKARFVDLFRIRATFCIIPAEGDDPDPTLEILSIRFAGEEIDNDLVAGKYETLYYDRFEKRKALFLADLASGKRTAPAHIHV